MNALSGSPPSLRRWSAPTSRRPSARRGFAKTDLLTEVVGEFPEVQGTMGKYYALQQGEDASVAAAIEEHYRPKGPDDVVPSDPVSIAVALADKIDTLVGFWAIDEKPTGSKDPYALRRAALGVIRTILESSIRLPFVGFLPRLLSDMLDRTDPYDAKRHSLEELLQPLPKHVAVYITNQVVSQFKGVWQ